MLLVTLGSLVTAGMNMFTALIGVGAGVLGAFAYGVLVEPIGPMTPTLAVMLGLALGIDYGLFILTRFRAELREGRDVVSAAGRAVAGRARRPWVCSGTRTSRVASDGSLASSAVWPTTSTAAR